MSENAEKAFRAGRDAYNRMEYSVAASAFEHAVTLEPENIRFLNAAAVFAIRTGRKNQAEMLYRQAVAVAERGLGLDHPLTASATNSLVELYRSQGRYREAVSLCLRILAATGPRRARGEGVRTVVKLADLYAESGRYADAETTYLEALAGRKRFVGARSNAAVQILSRLAALYRKTGRFGEAEQTLCGAIKISAETTGSFSKQTSAIRVALHDIRTMPIHAA